MRYSKINYVVVGVFVVAMLIAEHGSDEAAEIVKGWVANLAAPPFSNDTKVMEAIAAGLGDVGIVNTYYFGRLIKKNPNLPLALFWADQGGNGTHVNVSGAGEHVRAVLPGQAAPATGRQVFGQALGVAQPYRDGDRNLTAH